MGKLDKADITLTIFWLIVNFLIGFGFGIYFEKARIQSNQKFIQRIDTVYVPIKQ